MTLRSIIRETWDLAVTLACCAVLATCDFIIAKLRRLAHIVAAKAERNIARYSEGQKP